MSTLNSGGVASRLSLEPPHSQAGGAEYAAIAKGSTTPWRLGPATAMALEDSIQREGWPEGAVCESEKTMAEQFGVGIRLMRQAFRILQARGACRLQRGRRGGLVVLRPDLEATAAALADNLRWSGVTPEEIREARDLLQPRQVIAASAHAASSGAFGNPGLALAMACFDKFPEARETDANRGAGAADERADLHGAQVADNALQLQLKAPETMRANRASHMAWVIGQDITHQRCRDQDRLGSLWDLAEQYEVSLAVAIDAVRILEDAGVVACIKGRSGGVTLKLPDGDAVISVMHSYLAASGALEEECVSICHQLNTRAATKAAEHRSPQTIALIDEIYQRMSLADGPDVMRAWYELQKALHDTAGNRVLHLITRCLAAYTVRSGAVDTLPAGPRFLQRMVRTTGVMVAAIKAGDVAGAAHGQWLTRQVLDERAPVQPADAA